MRGGSYGVRLTGRGSGEGPVFRPSSGLVSPKSERLVHGVIVHPCRRIEVVLDAQRRAGTSGLGAGCP